MSKMMFCKILLLVFSFSVSQAQEICDCEKNFKWIKETFEKNDAGFAYAIRQKGQKAYESHTVQYLQKIKSIKSRDKCADMINEWLGFFRKGHFGVIALHNNVSSSNIAGNISKWPTLAIQEDAFRKELSLKQNPGFEGIWKTGAYTIAIQKQLQGYKGTIISSTNPAWKPGMVKLEINSDSTGAFYMGDFSANKMYKINKANLITPNTLKLATIVLDRTYPIIQETAEHKQYAKIMTTSGPYLEMLSQKTLYFHVPSFDGPHKHLIDSVINANKNILQQSENLIIDLRNNGGGNDDSYNNIIPYLYTNPIRVVSMELYSTPLNNKRMEAYLSIPDLSERSRTQVNKALKSLNDSLGKFVNFGAPYVVVQKQDSVFPFPKKVAIIINAGNGSSAEQFILAAKQSKKTKFFGVNTMGVLDFSNMNFVETPDKQFRFGYSISKSYRIPDMAIDGVGIQPDYYIDKTIPNEKWVQFVQQVIEQ